MGLFDKIITDNPQYDIIRNMTKDLHVHDYQLSVLYCYRNIPQKMKEFNHDDKGFQLNKEYFFISTDITESDVIGKVKDGFTVNSLLKFPGASKRCEVVYDIDEVFDREKYESGEKFKRRVNKSINYFTRENIIFRLMTKDDREQALELYDTWCQQKLADEKLFKIMFPIARYRNCLDYAIQERIPELKAIGCYKGDELLGFRIVGISGQYCYGLAFILDRDGAPCPNFSEKYNVVLLKWLKENYGIKYFNCGLAEGSLKKFKQHLPNQEMIYYRYTKSSVKPDEQ